MRQRRLGTLSAMIALVASVFVATPAQAAAVDYVALGDSYSSGVGAPGLSGLCLRSNQGYPKLWADNNDVSSYRSAACSGAETKDVRNFQIWHVNSGTDLVTISIGGNDVGFAEAIITCSLGSTASCLDVVEEGREYARTTLPGDLDATYAAIRRRAPNAAVYVLGYPRIFEETTTCSSGLPLSVAKRQAVNRAADELSDITADRAARAGFTYVDVRDEFAGRGLCGSTPWLNPFAVSVNAYHPNADGYRLGYLPALSAATG